MKYQKKNVLFVCQPPDRPLPPAGPDDLIINLRESVLLRLALGDGWWHSEEPAESGD